MLLEDVMRHLPLRNIFPDIVLIYHIMVFGSKTHEVNLPPHFTKAPPLHVFVRPEEHLILPCQAVSSPPACYEWFLNDQKIDWVQPYHGRMNINAQNRQPNYSSHSNNEYSGLWYFGPGPTEQFRPATYHCKAWNQYGSVISDPVTVEFAKFGHFPNMDEKTIILRPGETARLNCTVTPSIPKGITRWMLRAEDGLFNFLKESHLAATDDDGNLYLTSLPSISLDNSTYMCSVSSPIFRTIWTGPHVHVQFLQNIQPNEEIRKTETLKPRIIYKSTTRQVALVNHSLTLKCILSGHPLPNIVWQWSSQISSPLPMERVKNPSVESHFYEVDKISKSKGIVVRHRGTDLFIPSVKPFNQGTYRCSVREGQASSTRIVPFVTYEVLVEGPPTFAVVPRNTIIPVYGSTVLNCSYDSEWTRPPATLTWLLNSEPIDDQLEMNIRQIKNQSLYLNHSNLADVAAFQCKLNNTHGWRVANAYVKVWNQPPAIVRSLAPENLVAEVQSITLYCESMGAPRANIQWRKNEKPLQDLLIMSDRDIKGKFHITDAGNLIIEKVTISDSGLYSCTASNPFGSTNASGRLVVRKATHILSGPELLVRTGGVAAKMQQNETNNMTRIREQSFIQLTCEAKTDPLELMHLQMTWLRNNMPLESEMNHLESTLTISADGRTLKIAKTVPNDSGLYTCVARSRLDSDNASIFMLVQGKPGPPTQVTVKCVNTRADGSFAMISWLPGAANNAPIENTHIEMVTGTFRPVGYFTPLPTSETRRSTRDNYFLGKSNHDMLDAAINEAKILVYSNRWSTVGAVSNATLMNLIEKIIRTQREFNQTFNPKLSTAFIHLYADVIYYFRIRLQNQVGLSECSAVAPPLDGQTEELCYVPPEPVQSLPKTLFVYGTKPNNLVIRWTPLPPIEHNGPGLVYRITVACIDCRFGPNIPSTNTTVVSDWSTGELILDRLTTVMEARKSYMPDVRTWTIETFRTYEVSLMTENVMGTRVLKPLITTGHSGEGIPQLRLEPPEVQYIGSKEVILSWAAFPLSGLDQKVHGYFRGFRIEWCEAILTNELCEYYKLRQDYIVREPPQSMFANLRTSHEESELESFRESGTGIQIINATSSQTWFAPQDIDKLQDKYAEIVLSNNTYTAKLGSLPGRTRLKITISILNIQYAGMPCHPIYILTKEGVSEAVPEFVVTFVGVNHAELSWVQPTQNDGVLTAYDLEIFQVIDNQTSNTDATQVSSSEPKEKLIKYITIQDPSQLATRISELHMDSCYMVYLWPRTRSGRGHPKSVKFHTARMIKDDNASYFQISLISGKAHTVNISVNTHLLRKTMESRSQLALSVSSKPDDNQGPITLQDTVFGTGTNPPDRWLHDQVQTTFYKVQSGISTRRNTDTFYAQFRKAGRKIWEETQREFRRPWIVLSNLQDGMSPNQPSQNT
ncbi:hypothetical protein CRM22_006750 [Opisthorchis felineus]|uniref:Ig-like domain-containing protein n=1 Tax=Opisthorchis felineus TaxID=147828 RepID=A0A4S2LJG5_OPIFE|nr:hypothetical protein CRM22_006750 [Opisthorchis felineus]